MNSLGWGRKSPSCIAKCHKGLTNSAYGGKVLLTAHGRSLEREFKAARLLLTTVAKEAAKEPSMILDEVKELIKELANLVPTELLDSLSPMRDIQHQIYMILGTSLPNLPHYQMNPQEHGILQGMVDKLLQNQLI